MTASMSFLLKLLWIGELCVGYASLSSLDLARELVQPVPRERRRAEFEGWDFFESHGDLIKDAWKEFGVADARLRDISSGVSIEELIEPKLARAIASVRADPSTAKESAVTSLFNASSAYCTNS